jgi:hypothetical protein
LLHEDDARRSVLERLRLGFRTRLMYRQLRF